MDVRSRNTRLRLPLLLPDAFVDAIEPLRIAPTVPGWQATEVEPSKPASVAVINTFCSV